MPELKSLLLGLVFALGTFSVKSGCGVSYLLSTRATYFGKGATLGTVTLTYFVLFVGCWHICTTMDLVRHFNRVKGFFESGMALHVLMAGGTLLWAVSLLKDNETSRLKSLGWIPLVVPCPVCASVVFFITGFLVAFFPGHSFAAVLGAYAVYLVITLLTIAVVTLTKKPTETTPERTLGLAMLFVSAYFFISILVAPQFAELEKVYRIAAYSYAESGGDTTGVIAVGAFFLLSFATGFALNRIRSGR
jgi:predicted transporter